MRSKLCLNMIVKNEAARIVRCLESVAPYIDYYVIFDTGSTDATPTLIADFFDGRGIPGEIHRGTFVNFEQARNTALAHARASAFPWDYLLLTDADMEFVADDKAFRETLSEPTYNVRQLGGTLAYYNCRLVSRAWKGVYHGVTHEYFDAPPRGNLETVWFKDHQDGANRKEKYTRDITLLLNALKTDPNNGRYLFYLAQSYSDCGKHKGAITSYRKRIKLGGWDEEIYISHIKLAQNLKADGDEDGFIRTLLDAYNYRPTRAEAPWELAHYYRMKGMNDASLLFSEPFLAMPYPTDTLFVNRHMHTVGIREEFSICAFYNKEKRQHGFEVCDGLSLDKTEFAGVRDLARKNLFHYLKPLSALAPSFKAKHIEFPERDGYALLNPSVTNFDSGLQMVVRTVNYDMDKDGRYLIKNTATGEINNSNPINTRNYLVKLNASLDPYDVTEIQPPLLPSPQYPLVRGFEDMRLFEWQDDLWTSSTVRELNSPGWCEQVLAKIDLSTRQPHIVEWTRMLPEKRQHEKNWMPWVIDDQLQFVYQIGKNIDPVSCKITESEVPFAIDNLRGGTQVVPFHAGYLCLVHEAGQNNGKRYYQHRFVYMEPDSSKVVVSLPFVFHDKVIEFAAGLAWQPGSDRLVISYGRQDKEAWLATITHQDVRNIMGIK